jgi:DNA-binding MarR family transcriptional regulator
VSPPSAICRTVSITLPTTTVAVKRLEKKGFVTKAPSFQRRAKLSHFADRPWQKSGRAHSLFHLKMVKSISREFDEAQQEAL